MHARSTSSFVVSLTIHLLVAALIFFTTVYVVHQDKPPVIFELVAGPPTDRNALVAPAEGNSAKPIKLEVPKIEAPPLPPQEATPSNEPESKEETVPEQKKQPVKATAVKPAPSKPKADTSIAKEMKKSARISYQDYRKKHPLP